MRTIQGTSRVAHARPAGRPVLHIDSLSKHFGSVPALDSVDLAVGAGEVVAVVGEHGAGKSTLTRCLSRDVASDAGEILIDGQPLGATTADVLAQGVGFVWGDLGLCEDLDVTSNLFLGREVSRGLLQERAMRARARRLFEQMGFPLPELRAPVSSLGRGQRQMVAIGRALIDEPHLLVLDEPTASLSTTESESVCEVIRQRRGQGTAVVLLTHDVELAFRLAGRIVALRQGQVVGEISPLEVHPDDVRPLLSGIELDSMARRQLGRLHSLVDQLSGTEPAASLPLIMSAMATALDQEMLCLHLCVEEHGRQMLRLSAAMGLPEAVREAVALVPFGAEGGFVGLAAERREEVIVGDVDGDAHWAPFRDAARQTPISSAWSVPILGSAGVLGTISAFGQVYGGPQADRLELVSLYTRHAADAIEHERLLAEVTRRNRILETLRAMLETLAGPGRADGGLSVAAQALRSALGADRVSVLGFGPDGALQQLAAAGAESDAGHTAGADAELVGALLYTAGNQRAHELSPGVAGAPLKLSEGPAALVARWSSSTIVTEDALELLDDASRSLSLALEGEALEEARQEADALRRSQRLQRELISRLSHELRTPMTAIRGYASTLQQPDLTWDAASTERFLTAIANESSRMERLVGDLLDSSVIESGLLQLQRDWCDLGLVLDAARSCVPTPERVTVDLDRDVGPVWGDHDRLEQVFVNLLENALRHGGADVHVHVHLRLADADDRVEVVVSDDGAGIAEELRDRVFEPRVRGTSTSAGTGLGLSIARGIVDAHGGSLTLQPVHRGALFVATLPSEPPVATQGQRDGWEFLQEGDRSHA